MAKIYIEAPEIAQRLQEVHLSLTKGKRRTSRSIVLSRETFNRSAGRDKVEDPVYTEIARHLRKRGLHLLRFEGLYVLILDETLNSWPTPTTRHMKAWGS